MGQKVTAQRVSGDAGYFRIGVVVLDIPPEQIQCHKVINGEEVMPLRLPFSIPVKTGQSRWDVTWTWKAVQDSSATDPMFSWKQVQLLLAMFKAAPFVEVENEHIRQIVNPSQLSHGATGDDVMAFALRQMKVDTVPDLTDALQVTMTMSLFNFRPYSANFQYDSGSNQAVSSAVNSPAFQSYLQTWIQNNLLHDPTQQPATGDAVSSVDWLDQTPGTITLSAREYIACALPHDLPTPGGQPNPTPNNPGASKQGSAAQGGQSGFVDNVFIQLGNINDPKIQWWVAAAQAAEGAGYLVKNTYPDPTTGKTSSAFGILQWVKAAAIDAMKQADKQFGTSYIATAQQAGFLIASASASGGFQWSKQLPSGTPLSSDPQTASYWGWMTNPPVAGGSTTLQNNMATAWAYGLLTKYNGSVLQSWEADRFGPGKLAGGNANPSLDNRWFTTAVNSWRTNSGNPQDFSAVPNTTPAGAPQGTAPTTAVTSGTSTNPTPNISNSTNPPDSVPMTSMIRYFLNNGYTYDYATESAAFLYKEHWLKMADTNNDDFPDSSDIENIDPNHFVYPIQISVTFMNNIAQMPLASYQYPTYQHLGPVSTLVSIGLLSNAAIAPATDQYGEPEHTGLSFLSSMTNMLEEQYQRLRNEWRRVNSIHRMQSVSVKSQILNMLGIRGMLTREMTTETIPESPNTVTAVYNGVQYENIYLQAEGPSPFKVTTVPAQVGTQWLTTLRTKGLIDQFANDKTLSTLTNLSQLMQNPTSPDAAKLLFTWLTSAQPQPRNEAYLIPTPSPIQGTEKQTLLSLLDTGGVQVVDALSGATSGEPTFTDSYPDLSARIKSHSQLNFTDYFLIKTYSTISGNSQAFETITQLAPVIDQRFQLALNANPSFEPPINQLFDEYVDYAVANNVLNLRDQMVRALNTPQLKSIFVKPDGTSTPGSIEVNNTHGCYNDMGLTQISVGGRDNNPAVYFYDDGRAIQDVLTAQTQQVVDNTVKTSQIFANATPYADKSKLIQTSTDSFQGNVAGIIQNTRPPNYTMARAFPTFKLFLMEDHSDRPFYAYDNFYQFSSVLDFEVIRYRDKPDTARIIISNLLHLLDQHLYDSTPQGRFEQRLRANTEVALPPGESLTGGSNAVGSVTVNDAPGGEIYTLDNRFTQINATGDGDQKFPLKFFALQTGTKIQVRMGFSNNPDHLTPVFTGQVTEIEGNDILTITAQSYMLELIQPSPDELRHDGFALDSFFNNTANAVFKSVRDLNPLALNLRNVPSDLLSVFSNSAAYGGWGTVGGIRIPGILTTGGSSLDVISAMLKVSTAKHFGFWQPGAPTDPYLKGFSWQTGVASALLLFSNSPLTRGATGLEAGYDRSFENILTTHVFGADGTATDDTSGGARGWWFEKPAGYGAPEYHVPKDQTLTPWTLIQDIGRRFPEFILATKQYGFPFTADATLVYANPHDFYATRPPMPGEIEIQQQAASDNKTFFQWWSQGTVSGRAQFQTFCETLGGQWVNLVLTDYDQSIKFTGDSATSLAGQVGAALGQLNVPAAFGGANLRQITAEQLTAHIDGGGAPTFFNITQLYIKVMGSALSQVAFGSSSVGHSVSPIQAQQNLAQIIQNYYNFINQKTTGSKTNVSLNARMKPVRVYHLINGDQIVHNGITLNEKFYNSVRIGTQSLKANAGIPSQYIRLLNADPFIVSQDNIKAFPEMFNPYGQSFLKEELGKMYRGELVLLGNPDIEPWDILVMLDPSTGLSGPIEVDSVIHSFSQESGYITIVKPRAMVMVNDKLSAPLWLANWQMLTDIQGRVEGYASKLNINAPLAEVGLGVAAVAGGLAAGPWIAGAAALGGTVSLFWAGKEIQRINPMGIAPLSRFERPWVAGLEGWSVNDLFSFLAQKWSYFKAEEIEPLIFSYRTAKGMQII